jgi:hypothetical protein
MAYAITTTVTASGLWSLVTLVSGDSGEKMIFFSNIQLVQLQIYLTFALAPLKEKKENKN